MNTATRVLNLLHAARPEDVAAVLSLLSDAELAAGLADDRCDPELGAVPPDRDALRHALLGPRRETESLLDKPGAVQDSARLAARTPYAPVLHGGITPYGRPRADLNRRLSAALTAALGSEPWRWYGVLRLVDTWPGSVTELLDRASGWASEAEVPEGTMRFRLPGQLFLPGVLLALAPPDVVTDVLRHTEPRSEGMLQGLLKHAPYHPAYLEYAFGPEGSDFARRSLCSNGDKPLAVAHELLDRDLGPEIAAKLADAHDDLALRLRVYRSLDASADPLRTSRLGQTSREQVYAMLATAGTAEELYWLLKVLRRTGAAEFRMIAYRRLAEMAGPEPVWNLELAASGGLELLVHPAVRESMAGGGLAPLIAAAEAITPPGPPVAPPHESLTEWPVEAAVRGRLDGRLDRWRALLGSSEEEAAAVLGLAQWATGRSVRPAGHDIEDLSQSTKTTPPATADDRGRPATASTTAASTPTTDALTTATTTATTTAATTAAATAEEEDAA